MFKFGRKKAQPQEKPQEKMGIFTSLKAGLRRTRENLANGIKQLVGGGKAIDEATLEALETLLLTADVGIEATERIISRLTDRYKRKELQTPDALSDAVQAEMLALLEPVSVPLEIPKDRDKPYVILVVGVNGAGKTTTIGKLAHHLLDQGFSVALAAGDTFRAAAIEQLKTWGERNNVPVTAQQGGADPASVVFDALSSCQAKGIDILIADTAGRLHTQSNLMEELKKVGRVLGKLDPEAPHEVLLVIDATNGQNALNQATQFNDAVGLTGIAITKLDGTAKGGIVFALAHKLGTPIRFIGIGEQQQDLRVFNAKDYAAALLEDDAIIGND